MPTRPRPRLEEKGVYLYYLYCFLLTPEPVSLTEKGVDGRNGAFALFHNELSALVSWVPVAEYCESALNENIEDLEWLTPRVKRHEQVIKAAMEFGPVIPARFGTIYKSRGRIQQVLRKHDEELRAFLTFVQGKEEWGVKIYLDEELGERLVHSASPVLRALDERLSAASPGEGYFLRKRREKILSEEVEETIAVLTQEIYRQISTWSVASRRNRLLDRCATGRNEAMILNAAFLLDKRTVRRFVEWLDTLAGHYTKQGFFFELSGPWPPYNFCPQVQ